MSPDPSQPEVRASPGRSVEIPEPIRAAAGLAATVLDQARHLPATITGLPVRAAGIAMQTSLRLQQHYASLVVKGDELLTQINRSDADPPWATFDDDVVEVADAVTENVGMDVTTASGPTGANARGSARTRPLDPTPANARGSARARPLDPSTDVASEDALPSSPGMTRTRPRSKSSSDTRMGHAPSAFDLAEDMPSSPSAAGDAVAAAAVAAAGAGAGVGGSTTGKSPSKGRGSVSGAAPVPGYDAFTLAQLRARLRTFDAATLHGLLNYEREQLARTPYVTMLENRLNRSREQG